jgi:hypothetical protein
LKIAMCFIIFELLEYICLVWNFIEFKFYK